MTRRTGQDRRRGMHWHDWLRLPVAALAVLGKEKSFARNPVIGNPWLNRRGLHVARVKAAAAMAQHRRRLLARHVDPADAETFARDGFILIQDFLPDDRFRRLRDTVLSHRFAAREMRQGNAVTRMTPLGASVLRRHPALGDFYRDRRLLALFHYVASHSGATVNFIETVLAGPADTAPDPQTDLHADSFHSTAKFWLFLDDVADDGGPFRYVPGSHRPTPQRLDWEYRKSLDATSSDIAHHSYGSFRVHEDELAGLGYGPPQRMTVPANTLLIGDTFGFHARSVSERPTVRLALHGYLRRNPFLPWPGLDVGMLPGVRGRQLDLYLGYLDLRERMTGRRTVWRDVGTCHPLDPAHI